MEDHSQYGGLFSLINQNLIDFKSKFNLDYIAIQDIFVDSGKPIELEKKYGFDPLNIARRFSEIENS